MKQPFHLPYNKNLKMAARALRSKSTDEENKLWYQYLRFYPVKFIRQKIVDNCIMDFYCSKCRLGIEIDGKQHYTEQGIGHDEARTRLLNAYGVTILRFSNERIRNDFFSVCREIDVKVKESLNNIKL